MIRVHASCELVVRDRVCLGPSECTLNAQVDRFVFFSVVPMPHTLAHHIFPCLLVLLTS